MEFDYTQLPETVPQCKRVTLTADQVKALQATPIEIVAAPGVGYFLEPTRIRYTLNPGVTPFTLPGGDTLELIFADDYETAPWTWGTDEAFLASVVKTTEPTPDSQITDYISGATADFENLGLFLTKTGVLEYTLGDGTLDVVVHFLKMPIA